MSYPKVQKVITIFFLLTMSPYFVHEATSADLTLDGTIRQGEFPHFWSECVGTGTMDFCLRPEWQEAAKIGAKEAGFKRVRGHGILIHWGGTDGINIGSYPNWNFTNVNRIYDTILACGLEPVVELDFMPVSLQSNGNPSPPKDYSQWQHLVTEFAKNLINRYGAERVRKWYWEVWNEPNWMGSWKGTMTDYYKLFKYARAGIKSVDSSLIVGGPATIWNDSLQSFYDNCPETDFLSNHCYGWYDGDIADAVRIRDDNRVRATIIKNSGKKMYSLNTEYSSNYSGGGGNTYANVYSMDSHRNAAFVAKVTKLIVADHTSSTAPAPDIISYWAISDVFDEAFPGFGSWIEDHNKIPFGQVFGLINYQGIRKPTFNAFKMLNMMGTTRLSLNGGSGDNDGVDGFAAIKDTSQVSILVYNYYKDLSKNGPDETVNLTIKNLPFPNGSKISFQHFRVDSTHSNAYTVWQKNGKPVSPTPTVWDSMRAQQNLALYEPATTIEYSGSQITKSFPLPRWGVSLFLLKRVFADSLKLSIIPIQTSENSVRQSVPFLLKGSTFIINNHLKEPVDLLVYSAQGQVVKKCRISKTTVNIGIGLASGFYIVRAFTSGVLFSSKMIVE
jgi:xylan 1,4-beta-xylosidase